MNTPPLHKALQFAVILSAIGFMFTHLMRSGSYSDESELEMLQDSIIERNERSTPRSFILPATPAVAFEQEAQMAGEALQTQVGKCAGALLTLGYQLEDNTNVLNAKFVEAVFSYQTAHNLPATGRLDQRTKEKLKCM